MYSLNYQNSSFWCYSNEQGESLKLICVFVCAYIFLFIMIETNDLMNCYLLGDGVTSLLH